MSRLKSLLWTVLSAAPFLLVFPGCDFERHCVGSDPGFCPGDPPRTTAIFCDIEVSARCATPNDVDNGIERPFQDGFWLGKSGPIGLIPNPDGSCPSAQTARFYRDAFPTGSLVCLSPDQFPYAYANANEACQDWCDSKGWRDGDGNPYHCTSIAWRSNGADTPFPNACNEAGTVLVPGFKDPRTPTIPVDWIQRVRVHLPPEADLIKDGTNPDPNLGMWGDSGAVSRQELTEARRDGSVLVTASETTTFRIFGLGHANGTPNINYNQVEFGLLMTNQEMGPGMSQLLALTPRPDGGEPIQTQVGVYTMGDVLEVGVFGGKVQFRKNAELLLATEIVPTYPLRVEAALFNQTATIRAARASF